MGKTSAPVNGENESSRSTERLRVEMARTRDEMTSTLEQLHGKLNPTVLKEQALEQLHDAKEKLKVELQEDYEHVKEKIRDELREAKAAVRGATVGRVENMYEEAGAKVRDTGHAVSDTIKSNPIPAALAGIGLAWLFAAARSSRRPRMYRYDRTIRGELAGGGAYRSRFEGGPELERQGPSVAERARDVTQQASERLSSAGAEMGQMAENVKQRTVEGAERVSREAQFQMRRIRSRGVELFEQNPLTMGAAFVAIGAAIGFLMPRTRREDQLLGSARDRVIQKAEELAHGAIDKVEESTSRLAEQIGGEERGDGRDEEEVGEEDRPLPH